MIVANDSFYFSCLKGERFKVFSNFTLAWSIVYYEDGYGMAISPDNSFLFAGGRENGG